MNHHRTVTLLAILGLVSFAVTAQATDDKHYPGITCHHYAGGTYGIYYGTVANLSDSTSMEVVCPFVRDYEAGAYIAAAAAIVWDRNSNSDVTCQIRYETISGTTVSLFSASDSSSGSSSNTQQLDFGEVSGGAYYYGYCSIPPSSSGQYSHVGFFAVAEAN